MAESTEGAFGYLVATALVGAPLPEGGNAPLNTNNDTDLILCYNNITKRIDTVSKASIESGGTVPNLANVLAQGSDATSVTTPVNITTLGQSITLGTGNASLNLNGGTGITNITGGGYGILMNSANNAIRVTGGGAFQGLKYNADYSANQTDPRDIPDIGKVNALINGAIGAAPTLKSVIEENPVATGLDENVDIETTGTFSLYAGSGLYVGDGGAGLGTILTTGVKPAKYQNDVTDLILTDFDIPNKKYVDDAVAGGGGAQNLEQTLTNGNTTTLSAIFSNGTTEAKIESGKISIADSNYSTTIKAGLVSFTNIDTEYTVDLVTKEPLVDGAVFSLPAVTTVQEFIIPIAVNQVQPNDGGVIFLGLAEVISQSGYVEAPDGSFVNLDPNTASGFGSFGTGTGQSSVDTQLGRTRLWSQNELGTLGTYFQTINGITTVGKGDGANFGGFLFDADYTSTMTTDRHIPDIGKVNSLIAAAGSSTNLSYTASPTSGTVNSSTGTGAAIPLANGTNAGLLAPADFTKLGNQSGTNTGDNATNTTSNTYADGKVADNLTASTTVAPSKTAVNTALALKAPLASPAFTGNPTAPTPTAGDNDTSIATTAFVTAADAALMIPRNIVIDVTDSTAVTGVTTEQIAKSYLIPSGALATGILELGIVGTKTGSSGTTIIKVWYNTTNSLSGATQIAIATSGAASAFIPVMRSNYSIRADNTINGFSFLGSSPADSSNNNTMSSTSFNPATPYYFLVTLTNAAAGDSSTIKNVQIKFNKTT